MSVRRAVRLPIRLQMVAWLAVIFTGMLAAMNFFIARDIASGNEQYINDDLVVMKNNGHIYVKQILVMNDLDNNQEGFAAIAQEVVEELAGATGNPTAAYSMDGQMIAATNMALFAQQVHDDLRWARAGNPAFTLNTEGGRTLAYFTYPIAIEGNNIGMIRTVNDYTILYLQGGNTIRSVSMVTLVVFVLALGFALFFSNSIARPISRLAALSSAVQRDVEQAKLDIGKVIRFTRSRRPDEIGLLNRNFAQMILKIDQQMKTINSDKYELKRLSEYTKQFYDSVTHELKTPLTSIRGYAEVLEENGFTDKEFFDKGVSYIKSESDRMYQMVVDLLEYSKMSGSVEFPKEPVDMAALVEEVCGGMQFKAERYGDQIELVIRQKGEVFGSASRLKEVFINLVDNAIKYGYSNQTIQVVLTASRESVQVHVANAGEGVEEGEIPKLFIPFYRRKDAGKREEGSSGLGLGICKQIVEAHGGRIEMSSRHRGMTVVSVTLPALRGLGV